MRTHKTGNLEHLAQPAGSSAGWTLPFPGASIGLNLFLAAPLVPASPSQLSLSRSLLWVGLVQEGLPTVLITLRTEGLGRSDQFQGLAKKLPSAAYLPS